MQEADYQKHHTELEGKIAVAEMGTKFHPQLGKLWTRITEKMNVCSSSTLCHCFCYLESGTYNISDFPGLPSQVRNCTLFILGNHILHSDISAQKSRQCSCF